MDWFLFLWKLNPRAGIRHGTLNASQEILIYGIKPSQALNAYLADAYELQLALLKFQDRSKIP